MMQEENLFKGVGVEISLPSPDSFLKVKETLTRIGISSRKEKKLYQSYLPILQKLLLSTSHLVKKY